MLAIDRTASARVQAPPERCRLKLREVERYPDWSSLIREADVRDSDHVHLRVELLGISLEMTCELAREGDRTVLRRIPHDAHDDERFEATWTVTPSQSGSSVSLHVIAN